MSEMAPGLGHDSTQNKRLTISDGMDIEEDRDSSSEKPVDVVHLLT
jgi:hypothetical protein